MKAKIASACCQSRGVEENQANPVGNLRFIGLPSVVRKTSLGKTSIYTIPDFPKPVKIKGADATAQGGARWVESEVEEWMLSRILIRNVAQRGT